MTTINLAVEYASLGETTEQQAAVFAKEVQSRIEAEYPDADVTVTIDIRGFGGLTVRADDDTDEICENVTLIQNDVWENGNWHYE